MMQTQMMCSPPFLSLSFFFLSWNKKVGRVIDVDVRLHDNEYIIYHDLAQASMDRIVVGHQ